MKGEFETVLGIDPALSKSGLCLLDPYEGFVVFQKIVFNDPFEKTFKGLYGRIQSIEESCKSFIDLYVPDVVCMEAPLPIGNMAAGLSSLSTLLASSILNRYGLLYTFHPRYLGFLLGKKSYNHREYVALSKKIIEEEGFSTTENRISADEAAAFLFAFRICILCGYTPKVTREKFLESKEIILLK